MNTFFGDPKSHISTFCICADFLNFFGALLWRNMNYIFCLLLRKHFLKILTETLFKMLVAAFRNSHRLLHTCQFESLTVLKGTMSWDEHFYWKPIKKYQYFLYDRLFGSVRTEWGHLTNPQLAWHSYRQEPVAVRAVTLHSSHPDAGMKQYECGRTQPLLWTMQWSTGN
jgi:hypothetical protein